MKWYIIEGNIGTGKSTLLNLLAKQIECETIPEPLDVWLGITDDSGKNLLQMFYEDTNRYAYLFQSIVFKTRIQSIKNKQDMEIRFSERSVWSDKYIFSRACQENRTMNEIEYKSYNLWFDWLEEFFMQRKPDGIIYLKCQPETCYNRMKNRSRSEEDTVPLNYLTQLHQYHEDWLNHTNIPVLILDNETNPIESHIEKIIEFTQNT